MRRKWAIRPLACAAALTLAGAAHAADNILVNGGFESGLASWTTSDFILQGYDHGLDGTAHSGSRAFYGGGIGAPGFLQQLLLTEVGQAYEVRFWLHSDGYMPNQLQVLTDGQVRYSASDMMVSDYALRSATFTATQTQTALRFGLRDDSGFLHLDDISVSAVPEPGALALLLLGLGALAVKAGLRRLGA